MYLFAIALTLMTFIGFTVLLWSKCIVVKEYFGTRTFSPFEYNNNNEGEKKDSLYYLMIVRSSVKLKMCDLFNDTQQNVLCIC